MSKVPLYGGTERGRTLEWRTTGYEPLSLSLSPPLSLFQSPPPPGEVRTSCTMSSAPWERGGADEATSLELSDTRVYESQIPFRLRTTAHFWGGTDA